MRMNRKSVREFSNRWIGRLIKVGIASIVVLALASPFFQPEPMMLSGVTALVVYTACGVISIAGFLGLLCLVLWMLSYFPLPTRPKK